MTWILNVTILSTSVKKLHLLCLFEEFPKLNMSFATRHLFVMHSNLAYKNNLIMAITLDADKKHTMFKQNI